MAKLPPNHALIVYPKLLLRLRKAEKDGKGMRLNADEVWALNSATSDAITEDDLLSQISHYENYEVRD